MNETIVAFRTHLWNDGAATHLRKLYGAAAGLDFCVLADETRAPLPIPEQFHKISHTDDFSAFGLPKFPATTSLWYNGDYPLYLLRHHYPDAKYFILSEHDVAVNTDLHAIMQTVRTEEIDLVGAGLAPAGKDWLWYQTASPFFDTVFGSFVPFMIVSARLIDILHQKRLDILARIETIETDHDWPLGEALIGSTALNHPTIKVKELGHFVALPYFLSWPPLSTNSAATSVPNSIVHPVLPETLFIPRLLIGRMLDEICDPDGPLSNPYFAADRQLIVTKLGWLYRALGRTDDLSTLHHVATQAGLQTDPPTPNLARNHPALQSSTCEQSLHPEPDRDARLGNHARKDGPGFHTASEDQPWWQCDLERPCAIDSVTLFNRMDRKSRCTRVSLLLSIDGTTWTLAGAKLDATEFGGADGLPYIFHLSPPRTAQFVRIQMIGTDYLHLDQIEVAGTEIT